MDLETYYLNNPKEGISSQGISLLRDLLGEDFPALFCLSHVAV